MAVFSLECTDPGSPGRLCIVAAPVVPAIGNPTQAHTSRQVGFLEPFSSPSHMRSRTTQTYAERIFSHFPVSTMTRNRLCAAVGLLAALTVSLATAAPDVAPPPRPGIDLT